MNSKGQKIKLMINSLKQNYMHNKCNQQDSEYVIYVCLFKKELYSFLPRYSGLLLDDTPCLWTPHGRNLPGGSH